MNEDEVGPETKPGKYVKWSSLYAFEARGLTVADLKRLGAEGTEDQPLQEVWWNQANNWTVKRAELPLDDVQLGTLLADNRFFLA